MSANHTLGDLLHSDGSKPRIPEADWAALMRAIVAKDLRALRSLYDSTHRIVFTLSLRITGTREAAEEVTLETFHDVWRRADQCQASGETVLGWILNHARARALARVSPDKRVIQHDRSRQLRRAIGMLTLDERSAIETAYFSETTAAHVAARLNQPVGITRTRIRSGLQKLRRMMDADLEAS